MGVGGFHAGDVASGGFPVTPNPVELELRLFCDTPTTRYRDNDIFRLSFVRWHL